jgi:hypothetical protein
MAQTSLKKAAADAAPAEPQTAPQEPSNALAERPAATVGFVTPNSSMEGEFDMRDIQIPRLSQVQKVGNLSDSFAPGAFVYNKEVVVSDGKTPMKLIVAKVTKKFIESLPFGSEAIARVYNRVEDARADGLVYGVKGAENAVVEFADMIVLLEKPETANEAADALFTSEFEGKSYGLALWTLRSSAYSAAAKPVITTVMQNKSLRAGTWTWDLTSELRKNGQNSWYVPKIRISGKTKPELVDYLYSLLGQ